MDSGNENMSFKIQFICLINGLFVAADIDVW
jgi:hypothetical protein